MATWFWPAATSENTLIVRVGRVLHWLGYGVAAFTLIVNIVPENAHMNIWEVVLLALFFAIVGRLARYVLASE